MNLTSIRQLLHEGNLNRLMKTMTLLVRIALIVCTLLFLTILMLTPFTDGNADNHAKASFFFAGLYSILWLTIPSIFLLTAIALDNRYRKKKTIQPIRCEVRLLIVNIILIVTVVAIIGLIRFNQ